MAKYIDLGELPPDDPIYLTGFIVGGRRLKDSKNNSVKVKMTEQESKDADQALSEKTSEELED